MGMAIEKDSLNFQYYPKVSWISLFLDRETKIGNDKFVWYMIIPTNNMTNASTLFYDEAKV